MQLALEDGQLLGLPRLSGNTNDPNEEILFDSRKNSNSTKAYVPKPEETSSKPKPEPIAQNFCISSGVQTCAASEEEEELVESLELFFFLLLSSSELFPFFRLSLTFLPDTPFGKTLSPLSFFPDVLAMTIGNQRRVGTLKLGNGIKKGSSLKSKRCQAWTKASLSYDVAKRLRRSWLSMS